MSRELRRKEKYSRLRKVGFSSKFANKYKDRGYKVIDKIVEIKTQFDKLLKEALQNDES